LRAIQHSSPALARELEEVLSALYTLHVIGRLEMAVAGLGKPGKLRKPAKMTG
jgi:hypothetical protein